MKSSRADTYLWPNSLGFNRRLRALDSQLRYTTDERRNLSYPTLGEGHALDECVQLLLGPRVVSGMGNGTAREKALNALHPQLELCRTKTVTTDLGRMPMNRR
jgi:hypothetical protein